MGLLLFVAGCGVSSSDETPQGQDGNSSGISSNASQIVYSKATDSEVLAPDDVLLPSDADIHIVDVETGEDRALTSGAGIDDMPVVSSDGNSVFFSRTELGGRYPPGSSLYKVDLSGGEAEQITDCRPPDCLRDTVPAISPAGELWFTRLDPGGVDVRMLKINLDSGLEENVDVPPGFFFSSSPVWRTDEDKLIWGRSKGKAMGQYQLDDGNAVSRYAVCVRERCGRSISFSLNGALAFTDARQTSVTFMNAESTSTSDRIFECDDQGHQRCPISVDLSGNGDQLAVGTSDKTGVDGVISVFDTETGKVVFSSDGPNDRNPSWLP
ncbi:MAG: hypothetical protein ACK5JT_03895 [Hyphomicrobiaceae bacterium]